MVRWIVCLLFVTFIYNNSALKYRGELEREKGNKFRQQFMIKNEIRNHKTIAGMYKWKSNFESRGVFLFLLVGVFHPNEYVQKWVKSAFYFVRPNACLLSQSPIRWKNSNVVIQNDFSLESKVWIALFCEFRVNCLCIQVSHRQFLKFLLFVYSLICVGHARAGYTPITKQYQVLNHHTDYDNDDDNQNAGIDAHVTGVRTSSFASSSSSSSTYRPTAEYIANAPNTVTYTIYGYQHSKLRTFFYHVISILLLAIPYLIAHISTSFLVWLKWKKSNLDVCDYVLG